MHKDGDQIHETGDEAREAVDVPGMTWVLFGSIALAILALVCIWFFWMR